MYLIEIFFVIMMEEDKLSKIGKLVDEDDVIKVFEIINDFINEVILKLNFVVIG